MNSVISEKLKQLPELPGVYIMKDKSGHIIYVGKAKKLTNRVKQYFGKGSGHTSKVAAMVEKIEDFEYIITDSEFEALCLECNLIKKHKPKYNILLKDDKGYPFIKVTVNEEYPTISMARKVADDGARYFGPYPGSAVIKDTIDVIRKIFNIQHCGKKFPRDIGKERPCLYYSMKQCIAPCMGDITKEDYQKIFKQICDFLDGDHEKIIKELEADMNAASAEMAFERAAAIRDRIYGIKKISEGQKVISCAVKEADIIALESDDDLTVFTCFYVRAGKLVGSRTFKQSEVMCNEPSMLYSEFITAYYENEAMIPKVILCADKAYDMQSISEWLSEKKGAKVSVRQPVRGELRKLADMAKKNSRHSLSEFKINILKKNDNDKALSELANALGMTEAPAIIEAYDISNTAGSENVASMIVFKNGRKSTGDYKRFKIKNIVGSNDYECMKEVLVRRFLRYYEKEGSSFDTLPSLILVDGGKGHVSAAKEALGHLDIKVPVYGMVKDDNHKTANLTDENNIVGLTPGSPAFRLVTLIQDEAHRFAITYHKNLRKKKSFESELEEIRGVSTARRQILMKHLKSVSKIKNATEEELAAIKGIDKVTAKNIYNFFHNKEK